MSTIDGQSANSSDSVKPPRRTRRKKGKEVGDIFRDFLQRTGLNEDLEAAVAHVARHGINNFWQQFQAAQNVDVQLPPPTPGPTSTTDGPDDPYMVLGVHRNTPPDIIRAVYLAWAKNHHPDVGGDPEQFKKVNVAYDEIKKEKGL